MALQDDLQRPFDAVDIEWRIGRSGKSGEKFWAMALAYLTNRAIMSRLDSVVGPGGWKNEFKEWKVGENAGVICGISIRIDRPGEASEWVTKWDGAENTDIESVKGGLSDAMKRCAVQWGIGRYLYNLDETFCVCSSEKQQGWNYAKTKDGAVFYWQTPGLPGWALPNPTGKRDNVTPHVKKWAEKLATNPDMPTLNKWLPEISELEPEEKTVVKNLVWAYGEKHGWKIPKGSTEFVNGAKR